MVIIILVKCSLCDSVFNQSFKAILGDVLSFDMYLLADIIIHILLSLFMNRLSVTSTGQAVARRFTVTCR